MLNPVHVLYLGQPIFGFLFVFTQGMLKITTDMRHAIDQPHVGVGLEGCLIACKTVALKVSFEVVLAYQ